MINISSNGLLQNRKIIFILITTFLGLSDIANEGYWVWSSDGSVPEYKNWGNGEPNGGTNENCANLSDLTGIWHDDFCSHQLRFVCQKK